MHDARPRFTADGERTLTAMGDQGIDQGSVGIAGRGMHDKARGLVDDDQVVVFVDDIQRNILALRRRGRRRWHRHRIIFAWFDPVIGVFYRPRAQEHRAFRQQLLEPGTGEIGEGGGQETVQPPAGMTVTGKRCAPVA